MISEKKIDNFSWFLLVIISLIWGCSFILIKKSLVAFSPVQLGCLRLGISSVAFFPVIIYYRKEIEWKRFFTFVLAGLTGSGIPAFLFAIAQTRVTSSVAGMLNSMTPIWTLILGGIFFSTGFSRLKVTGVLSGFVGASALLWYGGGQNKMGVEPFYGFLILIATLCYGLSVNIVQHYFKTTKPLIISALSFFSIGIPALVFLFTTNFIFVLQTHEEAASSLLSVVVLSIFGTVVASVLFYQLVQRTNAVFGSSVTYFMPVVALGWGIADQEVIGFIHILAMLFILFGVYLIKRD
ncbi:MAG: DMT family transporter [Saprospiraceae bacterium]|nr:DMT family transporter [Saprospiraceae bacterium]